MVLKTDFQRSDVNSQDPLNENFALLEPLLEDTGWLDIELVNGADTIKEVPQYRVRNGQVFFRGGFGTNAQVGANDSVAPGKIPVEYAPKQVMRYRVALGTTVASEAGTIFVVPTGYIQIVSRVSNSKSTLIDSISYLLD